MPSGRFQAAIEAIDRANVDDPATVVVDGVRRPKEQAHAELMTGWVSRLDPDADELQLLAARAHHLRRWVVPRTSYPEGRAGYLRWRRDASRRQADEVATILRDAGYEAEEVDRVQQIVRKERLATDPAVQVHEDALCIVFLLTQLRDLADELGSERATDVLAKTARKMSAGGIKAAASLDLDPDLRVLLLEALESG